MPSNNNIFYTYAYLRANGSPYYIGKGCKNRAFKNRRRGIKPPKDISKILILKKNLCEEAAFKHEIYMISVFGRKDLGNGILINRTDGGDGCSGKIWSESSKEKVRRYQIGKKKSDSVISALRLRKGEKRPKWTEDQKKLIKGRVSPNKGKVMAEEQKLKISKSKKGRPWTKARWDAHYKKIQNYSGD